MIRTHSGSRVHTAHTIETFSEDRPRSGPLSGTNFKKRAKSAARQLGYPNSVIDKIEAADSEAEINRIMVTARKEKFDEGL